MGFLQILILVVSVLSVAAAFVIPAKDNKCTLRLREKWGADEKKTQQQLNFSNPLAELVDMWQNFDDIVDDFFNKRMGGGEQFYGQRKYKPSGKYSNDYNGYGFTDARKIEAAREFREERARMKEERLAAETEKNV